MTLVKSDNTPLAKAPGGTVLSAYTEEPRVTVLVNVYEATPYNGVNFPTVKKQLKFREGQVIKQKEWDAAFTAPTITSITPATGTAAGGTTIVILGTNFATGATVTVGAVAATSIVVNSNKKITCVTPAKSAGTHDVVVTTTGGTATKTGGFVTT